MLINDIYYVEVYEKMIFVYMWCEFYVMLMNIIEFCSKLLLLYFFCCYCLFCVNLNKICEIEPWFNNIYILWLKDLDFEVLVSCSKVKEFCQLMYF